MERTAAECTGDANNSANPGTNDKTIAPLIVVVFANGITLTIQIIFTAHSNSLLYLHISVFAKHRQRTRAVLKNDSDLPLL
jgi:hypothetical protein